MPSDLNANEDKQLNLQVSFHVQPLVRSPLAVQIQHMVFRKLWFSFACSAFIVAACAALSANPVPVPDPEPLSQETTALALFDVPDDMFYRPDGVTDQKWAEMRKRAPEYDRIVPGLGRFAPYDVRAYLATMGLEFQPGHFALYDATHGFLLLKGSKDQLDATDVITEPMGTPYYVPRQAWLTFLVSRVDHKGGMRLLRSVRVLCSQTETLWKLSAGLTSETIRAATVIGDDGVHGECIIKASFTAGGQRILLDQNLTVRTPEKHGQLLVSVPAVDGNGSLEVRLLTERCLSPSTSEMANLESRFRKDLAKVLIAALERRPAAPAGPRRPGLYSMPWLLDGTEWQPKDGVLPNGFPRAEKAPPALGSGPLLEAHELLQSMGSPTVAGDVALYSPQSGLLYVEAAESLHEVLSSVRPWRNSDPAGTPSSLVSLHTWQRPVAEGRSSSAPRQLLVKSGHRSLWRQSIEQIETEAYVRSDGATRVRLALEKGDFGNSGRWDLDWAGTLHSDGRQMMIAEDARPFHGVTRLSVSAGPPITDGGTIVSDPERLAAKIREIQSQLNAGH